METAVSVASKPVLKEYITTEELNQEMLDAIYDYSLTLRVSESTKELYLQRLRTFGLWLMKQGIKRFIGVEEGHINCFLATYDKNNTKNGYITALRPFYRDFLNKPNVVEGLKYYAEELEPITPSDVLTSNEVIVIAEKAGERREMYKVIILSLFESCARVNELLHLKKGDVQFHSVTDKEGHRKLIATLYFKRSKGKEGTALKVPERRKGVIFCSYTEKWKDELEERLQTEERVTLLAIGRNRYELFAYLQKRKDIEIVKVETRYMKNRDKGIGLEVTVGKI